MNIKEIVEIAKNSWTPLGNGFLEFLKSKEDTFIDYIGNKYFHDSTQRERMISVCKQVSNRGKFTREDLLQIQELNIPLGQINGFNLSGFRERTSPVSYDKFVGYLVDMCDGKFTVEQIKQTI